MKRTLIEPFAKDLKFRLNLCAVGLLPDHIAGNGSSCTKLLGVNICNEMTEATSHVSLKLSSIVIIAWSTNCLEKFALNLILRSYRSTRLTFAS